MTEDMPEDLHFIGPIEEKREPEKLILGSRMRKMVEIYAHSIKHVSPMLHKAMVKAYQQGVRDLVNMINDTP